MFVLLLFLISGASAATYAQTAVNWNGVTTGCAAGVDTTYLKDAYFQNQIPTPNVNMSYTPSTSLLQVNVSGVYLAQDNAWIVRFSPFNYNTDDVNAPGTCENRVASTYNGLSFDDWWTHKGNLAQSGAMTSASPNWFNPGGWTAKAVDCANILYSRSFTLSTLSGCKTPKGALEVSTTNGNGGTVVYSGNVSVSMVIPIYNNWGSGGKAAYLSRAWIYPFTLTFASSPTSTVLLSSGGNFFSLAVKDLGMIISGADAGKMYISIATTYYASGYGYMINNTLTSTTGSPLIMSGTPSTTIQSAPAQQIFTWVSTTVQQVYDGVYNFTWTGIDCTSPSNTASCSVNNKFTSSIAILLRNINQTVLNGAFNSAIYVYKDTGFTIPQSSSFLEGNPICFKTVLNAVLGDQSLYSVSINNMYLCSPNDQTTSLAYDGINTFGCLNVSASTTLVSFGAISTAQPLASYYSPTMYALTPVYTSGICITAAPRFMFNNGTLSNSIYKQYVQIELLVNKIPSSYHRDGKTFKMTALHRVDSNGTSYTLSKDGVTYVSTEDASFKDKTGKRGKRQEEEDESQEINMNEDKSYTVNSPVSTYQYFTVIPSQKPENTITQGPEPVPKDTIPTDSSHQNPQDTTPRTQDTISQTQGPTSRDTTTTPKATNNAPNEEPPSNNPSNTNPQKNEPSHTEPPKTNNPSKNTDDNSPQKQNTTVPCRPGDWGDNHRCNVPIEPLFYGRSALFWMFLHTLLAILFGALMGIFLAKRSFEMMQREEELSEKKHDGGHSRIGRG